MLLLYVVIIALLINATVNRRIGLTVPRSVRLAWVAIAGLALQALSGLGPQGATNLRLATWAMGAAAVAIMLAGNRDMPGASVAFVGLMLNALVILANEGMPVILDQPEASMFGFYRYSDASTLMPWLGDSLPDPTQQWLMSPGDVLMVIGIAVALSTAAPERTR